MKKLLTLGLAALLLGGCSSTEETSEDSSLLDMYETDVETNEVDETTDEAENPEDEPVTSVGPNGELPSDLQPSRPQ